MAITLARIEANGWVLALTGSWPASTANKFWPFADYSLTPDNGAKVKLTIARPGYVRSAGTAVAATRTKTAIALRPLRLPVPYEGVDGAGHINTAPTFPAVSNTASYIPTNIALDEIDNGSVRTVRIALSTRVYAGETLTLDVLAGWRAGEGAASAVVVTNNSSAVHAKPIVRPATVPLQVVRAPFRIDLEVVGHYPEGFDGVAGIRFWMTDGTNSTTPQWITGPSVSPLHGDLLKCWGFTVDPALGATLADGPCVVNYEVYPWTGALRACTTVGATQAAMLALATSTTCERGFPICYSSKAANAPGDRYPEAYVVFDPVAGTTVAAAAMVQLTYTAANYVAAAAKPKDLATAINAVLLANRTTSGGSLKSVDNAYLVCPKYVSALGDNTVLRGTTAVTTGLTNAETFLHIVGDPTLTPAQARAQCRIDADAVAPSTQRGTRWHLANLTVGCSTQPLVRSGPNIICWEENLTKVALTPSAIGCSLDATTTAGNLRMFVTNLRVTGCGNGFGTSVPSYPALLRNVQSDRHVGGMVVIGARYLAGVAQTASFLNPCVNDAASGADVIWRGIDLRGWVSAGGNFPIGVPVYTGGVRDATVRWALVNVVCELSGSTEISLLAPMDSQKVRDTSDGVFEGVSFIGGRINWLYDEPLVASVSDVSTLSNAATGNVWRNVYSDRNAAKSDVFGAPGVTTVRNTAAIAANAGYAAARTGTWPHLLGVDHFNVVDGFRFKAGTTGGAQPEGVGLGGRVNPVNNSDASNTAACLDWPKFTSDLSTINGYRGGATSGGGDYRPLPGSPLLGLATDANLDADVFGAARTIPFAIGAGEGAAVAVFPAGARSTSRAGSPTLGWSASLAPAAARLSTRAASGGVLWATTLAPPRGGIATRVSSPAIGWTVTLATRSGRSTTRAAPGFVIWSSVLTPRSGLIVTRTAAGLAGWSTTLVTAGGIIATRAAPGLAGWTTTLTGAAGKIATRAGSPGLGWSATVVPFSARSAMAAKVGFVGWSATLIVNGARSGSFATASSVGWFTSLQLDFARQASRAGSPAVTTIGPWLLAVASGRSAMRDRTLPILLPGSLAPPERTLTVTGDFRTTLVN